jgi:pyruvate dehydrogenase complex dehydrogenase (E1) component
MRKILIIACIFSVTNSYAQSPGAPAKSLTVQEANKLNGTASPTINGIPYSQYKAQQEALKLANLQAQQKQTQQVNVPSVITTDDIQKSATQPVEVKPTAPAAKPVSAQYADKTIPGTLVPMPAATVATSTEALVPVQTAVQPKMPVLNQQSQKVELETVPASVVQPAVKAAVVTMQTEKGKGG